MFHKFMIILIIIVILGEFLTVMKVDIVHDHPVGQ